MFIICSTVFTILFLLLHFVYSQTIVKTLCLILKQIFPDFFKNKVLKISFFLCNALEMIYACIHHFGKIEEKLSAHNLKGILKIEGKKFILFTFSHSHIRGWKKFGSENDWLIQDWFVNQKGYFTKSFLFNLLRFSQE